MNFLGYDYPDMQIVNGSCYLYILRLKLFSGRYHQGRYLNTQLGKLVTLGTLFNSDRYHTGTNKRWYPLQYVFSP